METVKPIKRSIYLAPLSREHHEGLLLCWKITEGLRTGMASHRIKAYIVFCFDSLLKNHFDEEEQFLFPLLPGGDKHVEEALAHHAQLRLLADGFRSTTDASALSLQYFADVLHRHIRLEERILFNMIEQTVDRQALTDATNQMKQHRCNAEWHDQFWLKQTN